MLRPNMRLGAGGRHRELRALLRRMGLIFLPGNRRLRRLPEFGRGRLPAGLARRFLGDVAG